MVSIKLIDSSCMDQFLGTLYIISAPSGTGKSSLIRTLMKRDFLFKSTKLSVSYTTRSIRDNETYGVDYFFISREQFKYLISQEFFFEYEKVFDNYYGTSRKIVEKTLFSGKNVILNIDWKGARKIRKKYMLKNVCTIFLLPPSQVELERRLRIRGQDKEKNIFFRLEQAKNEIKHFKEYDYVIINDNFKLALISLESIFFSNQLKVEYQQVRYQSLIKELLLK